MIGVLSPWRECFNMENITNLYVDLLKEAHLQVNLLESQYLELNEVLIDPLNSYTYQEVEYSILPGKRRAWQFEDRCGNVIVGVFIISTGEFKTGYKIPAVKTLVFQPENLPQDKISLVHPCPDYKRLNTVFKILVQEVVPNYILDKKPSRLILNLVLQSRKRLVSILGSKVINIFTDLIYKNNYILHI